MLFLLKLRASEVLPRMKNILKDIRMRRHVDSRFLAAKFVLLLLLPPYFFRTIIFNVKKTERI
jgi:hypothetical protein